MTRSGKVFKYGDNVDTDVIIPARYLNTSDAQELAAHCMEDIDPSFAASVQRGDILVAGRNFGCGSSREHAPLALKASVKFVDNVAEACDHIEANSSRHTEAVVAEDASVQDYFVANVDSSSVMVNASTRFADGGEYGLGAEVGISTDKLHARGPMGVESLCSYKWILRGNGQVRG